MSHPEDYYYKSSSAYRKTRDDRARQELPPLREYLPEHFEPPRGYGPYGDSTSARRLPPIQDGPRGYPPSHFPQDHGRPQTPRPSHLTSLSTREPSFHVLAPSHREGLIAVSESHTKPPGILRVDAVPPTYDISGGKKRFECSVCGRRMERQSVYNQHMLTHTGERPFACSLCPKAFNSKSNLNRHLLSHGRLANDEEDTPDRGAEPSSSRTHYGTSRRA